MLRSVTLKVRVHFECANHPELLSIIPWLLPDGPTPPLPVVPVVATPTVPDVPIRLPRQTFLSPTPCPRGHKDPVTGQTERYRRSNACVICVKEHPPRKKRQASPAEMNGHQVDAPSRPQGARPELPAHLRETCFLSPIVCGDESHRYRDTAYTLRFLDSEDCVQCTTQGARLVGV